MVTCDITRGVPIIQINISPEPGQRPWDPGCDLLCSECLIGMQILPKLLDIRYSFPTEEPSEIKNAKIENYGSRNKNIVEFPNL